MAKYGVAAYGVDEYGYALVLTSTGKRVFGSLTENGERVIGSLTAKGEAVFGVSSSTETAMTLTFLIASVFTKRSDVSKSNRFNISVLNSSVKQVVKSLGFSITSAFTHVAGNAYIRVLNFAVSVTNGLAKQAGKVSRFNLAVSLGLKKGVAKTLSYAVSASFVAVKNIARTFLFNVSTAFNHSLLKVRLMVLEFAISVSQSVNKAVSKTLTFNISVLFEKSIAHITVFAKKVLNKFRLKHYSISHYDDDD